MRFVRFSLTLCTLVLIGACGGGADEAPVVDEGQTVVEMREQGANPFATQASFEAATRAVGFDQEQASDTVVTPGEVRLNAIPTSGDRGSREGWGRGRVIAMVTASGDYEPLGLYEGDNYLWVDSLGAGGAWRAIMGSSAVVDGETVTRSKVLEFIIEQGQSMDREWVWISRDGRLEGCRMCPEQPAIDIQDTTGIGGPLPAVNWCTVRENVD